MARTPIHPAEVLAEELEQLGVSPNELARQIRVPANWISQIINGKRAITGDTALRLAHWFGTRPQFWMNLQTLYDVRVAPRTGLRSVEDGFEVTIRDPISVAPGRAVTNCDRITSQPRSAAVRLHPSRAWPCSPAFCARSVPSK